MATTPQDNNFVVDQSVDQILSNLPIGTISRSYSSSLYGINRSGNPTPRPISKLNQGYIFFTRPQLNLSIYNISNYTPFYSLLTNNRLSLQRYVRLLLDPRLAQIGLVNSSAGLNIATGHEPNLTSPFLNQTSAFIPILTNTITSLSGWPDLTVPVYTSSSGAYGEEQSFVDGVTNNFEAFDLDATFQNVRGELLIYLFYIWIKYESLVFEGILNPYLDFITENEIDYNTRIYRVVLDSNKRYVTYIACTGASFPINVPSGNLFDFSKDSPLNTRNADISIRFKNNGFIAFEDIIKYEFNEVTSIFNPSFKQLLRDDLEYKGSDTERDDPEYIYSSGDLVKIPFSTYTIFKNSNNPRITNLYNRLMYRSTPWINLYTNEFEWWVDSRHFGNFSLDDPDLLKLA